MDLSRIKQIPILDVASHLGILVRGKKAMCFGGHDKNTPSLSFLPNKNIWKCFGCGKGGDTISLVREFLSCDFHTALDWFDDKFNAGAKEHVRGRHRKAPRISVAEPRHAPRLSSISAQGESHFSPDPELYGWLIGECGDVTHPSGVAYLESHGISQDVARRFRVRELCEPARVFRNLIERWGPKRSFCSGLVWGKSGTPECLIWPTYSILFPFTLNSVVGYIQGRRFTGNPKYLNPQGIAKPLYNIDRLKTLSAGAVVHICEGVPDALALETRGLAAVAVLGATSFRAEWVNLFMRLDVVLMPDGDHGGKTFSQKISGLFMDRAKAVTTVQLPPGKDIADVLGEIRRTK